MTFRFDLDEDKREQEIKNHRMGSGLGSVKDYSGGEKHGESYPALNVERYDPVFGAAEEEEERGRDSTNYPAPEWRSETETFGGPEISVDNYGGTYHTRRPSYWWKFALSVAAALATGIMLGYAALSYIGGGSPDGGNGHANVNSTAQSGAGSGAESAGTGDSTQPITEVKSIPVQIARQSYYLLQYGVFSTSAGAEQARQELLAAGLAAAIDPADGNRVYAGMSPEREQAKLLSSGLKNQGIELYVREVTLPAADQAAFRGNAEELSSYFAISNRLLNELSGQSASLLSGAGQAADSTAVSDLHMQWTEAVKTLEQGLGPEEKIISGRLEKSMSRAIAAWSEYSKNQAQALLWEVQEAMIGFLADQKSLLSSLS